MSIDPPPDSDMRLHYSRALDHIYALRVVLAHEALRVKADLSYKTFPKSRRGYAEAAVERLSAAAAGDIDEAYRRVDRKKPTLRMVGAPETLTRAAWESAPDNGDGIDVNVLLETASAHPKWGADGTHCVICTRQFATDHDEERHTERCCDDSCWCSQLCWSAWGGECAPEGLSDEVALFQAVRILTDQVASVYAREVADAEDRP